MNERCNFGERTQTLAPPFEDTVDAAKLAIEAAGFRCERKSPFHLKIDGWNFYPTTGKITLDGQPSSPEKGMNALLRQLHQQASSGAQTRGATRRPPAGVMHHPR